MFFPTQQARLHARPAHLPRKRILLAGRPYWLGVAVEPAEPLFAIVGGELQFLEAAWDMNARLEVTVIDCAEGQPVPDLLLEARLQTVAGDELGTYGLPFLRQRGRSCYGRNIAVPQTGPYRATVSVEMAVAPYQRPASWKPYTLHAEAEFDDLFIRTGRR